MSRRLSGSSRGHSARAASRSPAATSRSSSRHSAGATFATPAHPADGAGGVALQRPVVAADEDLEAVARELEQVRDPARVARALLDRDDPLVALGERGDRLRREVLAAGLGVVVEHHRQVGRGRDRGEVRVELALVGDVRRRRQAHEAGRAELGGLRGRARRRSGRRATEMPTVTVRPVATAVSMTSAALVVGERAGLAHRAAHDDVLDAGVGERAGVVGKAVGRDARGRRRTG